MKLQDKYKTIYLNPGKITFMSVVEQDVSLGAGHQMVVHFVGGESVGFHFEKLADINDFLSVIEKKFEDGKDLIKELKFLNKEIEILAKVIMRQS